MSLKSCFRQASLACAVALLLAGTGNVFAQSTDANVSESDQTEKSVVRVTLNEDGSLSGHVFAMLDDEKAPMVAKVSLAADGKTVASSATDVVGNFSFADVEPGEYTMVGVSGEYVGDQVVVVSSNADESSEEAYTALALQVSPMGYDGGYVDAGYVDSGYIDAGVPMDSYASPVGGCSSCGGGGFGGGGGCGGSCGGGPNLRRLLLLGGAVAIPVALSASPDR